MIRVLAVTALFACVPWTTVQSQDKTPKAKADDKTTAKPAKPTPFDKVEGYKVHTLAGFTVIVSSEVLGTDTNDLKRKPLECLELELKNVAALMNAEALKSLRNVAIWAEWNEIIDVGNGRKGLAYASYYGGSQRNLLGKGMHPLKAKCVVLHLTKLMTKNYQDKDRPETLVMLHELAHAVHDQYLGTGNPLVKASYEQAMARKLYDKSLYIATNENEFFAESSCAYMDRLDYFPKNRDDLKKHDPETFKMLEGVWGKAATVSASAKSKRPADGSSDFNMEVPLGSVRWTKPMFGPTVKPDELAGRVVLLGYVTHEQLAFINRFKTWNDEFGPYGLTIVLTNAEYKAEPEAVAAGFQRLNLPFAMLEPVFLPLKSGTAGRAEKAGHAILFDPAGKILFRGQADDATIYLKEAIGKRLIETSGVSESEVPKQLQAAVDALKAGEPLPTVAAKLQAFTGASDAAVSEPAKKLLNGIIEPGTKALANALVLKKSDPLEAFLLAEKVSTQFKGLAVANKAVTLVQDLKLNVAVQPELKARKDFETVLKLETALTSQAGSFDPKSQSFRTRNGGLLRQLQEACALMKKNHPKARATEKAAAIAKEYGVD